MISFVVQDTNVHEMENFAVLGAKLGCDIVVFENVMNWNTFAFDAFLAKCVHYDTHPMHEVYLNQIKKVNQTLPNISKKHLISTNGSKNEINTFYHGP